jgi:hypothetical protein
MEEQTYGALQRSAVSVSFGAARAVMLREELNARPGNLPAVKKPRFANTDMEDRKMSRIKPLLFLLVLAALAPLAAATVTYVVGSCKPTLPSFTTINGALSATTKPNVIEICPGTYPEEVGIYFPVTLEGITTGNSDQVVITPPSGGLFVDSGDDLGDLVAAQVLVEADGGEVNLSNITIDGTGNNVATGTDTYVVGVFYQNTSGTVKDLTVQNQNGNDLGVAIWLEGGSGNPSVTVENNNLQAFDFAGIYAETNSDTSELTATIKGNYLAGSNSTGILVDRGQTASVIGNLISGGFQGVVIGGGGGSVSENKVASAANGILVENDGMSVTSNTIYNAGNLGIYVFSAVAPVTGNTIAQSQIAIEFECYAGKNVHSNTILDAVTGLGDVPAGTVTPNTYYNVGQINPGGC